MTSPSDLTWLVTVAGVACAYMSWGIGANDVANSFGPAFGARCLSLKQASVLAAVCELAGAILMGGHVSETIRKGMMDVDLYDGDDGRMLVMIGMTSVLFAAATWLLLASKYGLPVSTTHSAVGGVVAFAICSKGYGCVKWSKVLFIIASWFISPVLAALIGWISYFTMIHLVLKHPDSLRRAKASAPVLVFIMFFVLVLFIIYKGGKGLGLNKMSMLVAMGISGTISLVLALASIPLMPLYSKAMLRSTKAEKAEEAKVVKDEAEKDPDAPLSEVPLPEKANDVEVEKVQVMVDCEAEKCEVAVAQDVDPCAEEWIKNGAKDVSTERLFVAPVAIVAAFQSLAHGANDCANAVGPFAAVLAAYDGPLGKKTDIPLWVFFLAGGFIALGLMTFGHAVMKTIGEKITPMNPSKAFCSLFAVFLVCLIATRAGIPISTTHAAVGSVIGVGMAEGMYKVDWKLMINVGGSWVITLPIVGLTASGFFGLLLPTVWEKINLSQG